MFTMKAISMKLFRAAKVHVLTSMSIVFIAVSLILIMGVYIWNAHSYLEKEIQALYGEMDIMAGYDVNQQQKVSTTMYEEIKNLDGVTATSPVSLTFIFIQQKTPTE